MKKFQDNQGSVVYKLVDKLRIHLQYKEEVDDNIERDLNRLYREGNNIYQQKKSEKEESKWNL